MKKILVVFDGRRYSARTIGYAADVAKATNSLLVGVFLHDISYSRYRYVDSWQVIMGHDLTFETVDEIEEKKIEGISKLFQSISADKKVEYKIHRHDGVPTSELLRESAFADLIILDSKTSFLKVGEKKPGSFLKDILTESKCSVLIIPDKPELVKQVIVAYDGSDSSVYAMKMFSYIFPEWREVDTTVLTINSTSSNHVPQQKNIKDLANHHFRKISFEVIHGKVKEELNKFLRKHGKETLVVMGSYGRSAWSRMLHTSLSNQILKDVKMPLFIAHQ